MLFFSLFVFVSGYYYQQNDIGGYSLGVGGAPIGLNNSVECGFYNPAAFASTDQLKIFTGWKLTKGKMSMVGSPDDTFRLDYSFPDYLGIALPFGRDFFFGVSLSVPYRSSRKDTMTFAIVDETEPSGFRLLQGDYVVLERFYFLNTAVGKRINNRLSVGVNMGIFWNRLSDSYVAASDVYIDAYTIVKYGIEPCLGLQYKASDIFSFGFLIKKGFGEAFRETIYGTEATSVESDESLPLVLGFGTGINLKDKIYLNVSGEYMLWTLAYSGEYGGSDTYRNIIRLHFGAQYRFNDLFSLSAGFYTEPSPINIPSFYDPGSYNQMFLTGGVGLDFGRVALNLSAASGNLITKDPALRKENHFNLSLSYR